MCKGSNEIGGKLRDEEGEDETEGIELSHPRWVIKMERKIKKDGTGMRSDLGYLCAARHGSALRSEIRNSCLRSEIEGGRD